MTSDERWRNQNTMASVGRCLVALRQTLRAEGEPEAAIGAALIEHIDDLGFDVFRPVPDAAAKSLDQILTILTAPQKRKRKRGKFAPRIPKGPPFPPLHNDP